MPSKPKTKQDQSKNTHPPPGVFEPSCDLELQIPVSAINLPGIVNGRNDFSPDRSGTKTTKKGSANASKVSAAEKVVEKLLTKTGGHLLLKKKRRKAINRTGFPSKKKKKMLKVDDLIDSKQKVCDRVPVEGEDTKRFIERNNQPGRKLTLETDVSPSRSLRTREKPLQDKNKGVPGKKGSEKKSVVASNKREREEVPSDVVPNKRAKNGVATPIKAKAPRDKSSDSEPLINLTRTSVRVKELDKNKENTENDSVKMKRKDVPCSSTNKVKKISDATKQTPKRPSIEDAIKEKDKLTVSIERIPGLRIPEKNLNKNALIEIKSVTPSSTIPTQKTRGRLMTRRSDLEQLAKQTALLEATKSQSLPTTPMKPTIDRISRLEKLTREFNQKFAVVKLKSLDDSNLKYDRTKSEREIQVVQRPRCKSVGRGLLGKDAETEETLRSVELFKRNRERSKSVVRYIGMQPAELLQENILESRMRSRAKSVVRQLSPEKEEVNILFFFLSDI